MKTRRDFLKGAATMAAGLALSSNSPVQAKDPSKLYDISLAGWSLHKAIFGGKVNHLDFAKITKEEFGINGVEYVNQFFKDKATDAAYLAELNKRANDYGVKQLLIMIDGEGALGAPSEKDRLKAVENHHKWVDAAKTLGCHSIRVNAQSAGKPEEAAKLAADGLSRLTEYGEKAGINIIVENHGGISSNGQWLAGVIAAVNNPRCGTLPDFGNFKVSLLETYDRYKGVTELMPFAKAVSAKSHDFNEDGDEIHTDYFKMMKIVVDAGYHGFVGIEYEGEKLDEPAGIVATKKLLERVRTKLAEANKVG